jgi:hypothetical protein
LGFAYEGKIANSALGTTLAAGKIVILNVHNGGHWVLATAISGSTVSVNDPGYSTTSYALSEIVAGQTSVFKPASGFIGIFLNELEFLLNVNNKRQQMMEAAGGILEQ